MSPALRDARTRLEGFAHDMVRESLPESPLKEAVVEHFDFTLHRLLADCIAAARTELPTDRPF